MHGSSTILSPASKSERQMTHSLYLFSSDSLYGLQCLSTKLRYHRGALSQMLSSVLNSSDESNSSVASSAATLIAAFSYSITSSSTSRYHYPSLFCSPGVLIMLLSIKRPLRIVCRNLLLCSVLLMVSKTFASLHSVNSSFGSFSSSC